MALTDNPFVVHCHMPKTGGSALNRRLLFPRFGVDRVHQLYRFVFERSSRLPIRHRSPAMRAYAATGHVPFGYLDALYPDAVYLSIFRDPVSRFLSLLSFMLATPDHGMRAHLPRRVLDRAAEDPDALVYAVLAVPSLAAIHGNAQTRLAAGAARLGHAPVGPDHVHAAKANLTNPRYIAGLQPDLERFLVHLDTVLPGPRLGAVQIHPAKLEKRGIRRLALSDLAPRTLAAIEAANAHDCALLDIVARRAPGPVPLTSPDRAAVPCSSATAGGNRSAPGYPAETCPAPRPHPVPSAARATPRRNPSAQSSGHLPG